MSGLPERLTNVFSSPMAPSGGASPVPDGLDLDMESLGVFKPNRSAPLHRWVSFTEGFSAQLVARSLAGRLEDSLVYDPFGGTGTTPLVATQLGHRGVWCEINPYLHEASTTKVLAARSAPRSRSACVAALSAALLAGADWGSVESAHPLLMADRRRGFFPADVAEELLAWLGRFEDLHNAMARRLGRLAVATVAVPVSNMKRAADLRRRTDAEMTGRRRGVSEVVHERVLEFCEDLRATPRAPGRAESIGEDARVPPASLREVDLVVTSPPYLNGTNYFRNTKLELLLLGLIEDEAELGHYRARAVTAGINNVSRRVADPPQIDIVEPLAEQLDVVAYDARIPKMVRAYFADMSTVLRTTHGTMRAGGTMVLDIGDSRFAGVHVDTPAILAHIAESVGWCLRKVETIRSRVAKDGAPLCQKLLLLSA